MPPINSSLDSSIINYQSGRKFKMDPSFGANLFSSLAAAAEVEQGRAGADELSLEGPWPESTVICVDNSEAMLNGDFPPSRLLAQRLAAGDLIEKKVTDHPESNVGLLSTADLRMRSGLVCKNRHRIISKLHEIAAKGDMRLIQSLKIARMALTNRRYRRCKCKIVVFVGSEVTGVKEAKLVKLAKQLRKENISVDVVSFGAAQVNEKLLKTFVDTLNNVMVNEKLGSQADNSSHLLTVNVGEDLAESVRQSALMKTEEGEGGQDVQYVAGYDNDENLALALRISMEENRAREIPQAELEGHVPKNVSPLDLQYVAGLDSTRYEQQEREGNRLGEEEHVALAIRRGVIEEEVETPQAEKEVKEGEDKMRETIVKVPSDSEDKNSEKTRSGTVGEEKQIVAVPAEDEGETDVDISNNKVEERDNVEASQVMPTSEPRAETPAMHLPSLDEEYGATSKGEVQTVAETQEVEDRRDEDADREGTEVDGKEEKDDNLGEESQRKTIKKVKAAKNDKGKNESQ